MPVCQQCSKKVKTPQGLASHVAAKHRGNGSNGRKKKARNGGRITNGMAYNGAVNGLATTGMVQRPLRQATNRLFGSDFIGKVTAGPTTDNTGRLRNTFRISPSGYPGTRVTQLANLWERYRFRKFNLRYVPAVPKTLACQFLVYLDTDPNDDPLVITDYDAFIRQATAQTGAQQFNFHCPKVIPLAQRTDDQWYYTGIDRINKRFSEQGTGYLIQVTDPVDFNGVLLTADIEAGSLYIDWDVEFQIPQIEPEDVAAQSSGASGRASVFSNTGFASGEDFGTLQTSSACMVRMRECNIEDVNAANQQINCRCNGPGHDNTQIGDVLAHTVNDQSLRTASSTFAELQANSTYTFKFECSNDIVVFEPAELEIIGPDNWTWIPQPPERAAGRLASCAKVAIATGKGFIPEGVRDVDSTDGCYFTFNYKGKHYGPYQYEKPEVVDVFRGFDTPSFWS